MGQKKSKEWYALALKGYEVIAKDGSRSKPYKGLRSYADGFDSADGYDITKFDTWSAAKKAKVTKYYEAVKELNSRSNYLFRGRNKEHMEIAKKVSQHPKNTPLLKVAFVPYTPPMKADRTKETAPPKLHFTKQTMIVETPYHIKKFAAFDPIMLVSDTNREVARTIKALGDVKVMTVQAGLYEITSGKYGMQSNKDGIKAVVRDLMNRYDGAKELPGRKKHDNPKDHHYKDWLRGVVGYKFKPGSGGEAKLGRDMEAVKRKIRPGNRATGRRLKRLQGK